MCLWGGTESQQKDWRRLKPLQKIRSVLLCTSIPKPRTDRTCVETGRKCRNPSNLQISSNPSHLFRLFSLQFITLLFSVTHIFWQAYAKAKNCQHLTDSMTRWYDHCTTTVRPLYNPWLSLCRCELPTSEIKIESMETFLQKAQWNSKPRENKTIVNAVFSGFRLLWNMMCFLKFDA